MKSFVFGCLIVLSLVSIGLAQSGRKIKNPIPGTTSSNTTAIETATAEATKTETATVGYSESAPNQPVSISISSRNRNKNKTIAIANERLCSFPAVQPPFATGTLSATS